MKNTLITTALLSTLLLGCGGKNTPDAGAEEPDAPTVTKTGKKDPKEVVQG